MLTNLTKWGQSVDAVEVLSMLQQAWPGIAQPTGDGTVGSPWSPTGTRQWFWCAKELAKQNRGAAGGKAWISVGGRLLGVAFNNFYVSDYGLFVQPVLRAPAPVVVPPAVHTDPTYPEIFRLMTGAGGLDNAKVARNIRDLLLGGTSTGPSILPCLAVVLFVAEVARNHTAFHTNLMLLDLVEKAVNLSDEGAAAVTYRWENVLWQPGQIDANVALILGALNNRFQRLLSRKDLKNVTKGTSSLDETAQFGASFEGGEKSLAGGISPMAHTGSVRGSAFDLTGVGTHRFVKGGSTGEMPTFLHKSKIVQWEAEVNQELGLSQAEETRLRSLRPPPPGTSDQIAAVLESIRKLREAKSAMLRFAIDLAANERFQALTLVRRKEAAITIRWLSERLDCTAKFQGEVQGKATAYNFVEGKAGRESTGAESGGKDIFASKIMFEIQKRVDSFDLQLV